MKKKSKKEKSEKCDSPKKEEPAQQVQQQPDQIDPLLWLLLGGGTGATVASSRAPAPVSLSSGHRPLGRLGRDRLENAQSAYLRAQSLFLHSLNHRRRVLSAYKHIKIALAVLPNDYRTLILAANITSELSGKRTEALAYYDRAVRLEPTNPDPYEEKANTLLGWG